MDDRLSIILSPHFDDAALSLGGFIATAPERVVIVTVFAGSPAEGVAGRWDRGSGFTTGSQAMHVRARENQAALAALGVPSSGILDLDFLDQQYRRKDEAAITGLQTAIAETVRRIAGCHGGAVDVFSPISPWHPDHRLVTDTVISLWKARDLPGAEVLLYQDQPYAYLELRRRSLAPLRFASLGPMPNARDIPATPRWLGFEDAAAVKKRRAIELYASQFPAMRPLLLRMIKDFSRYQARKAGSGSRYAELVYRLTAPPHS